jgi:hypothetical protein
MVAALKAFFVFLRGAPVVVQVFGVVAIGVVCYAVAVNGVFTPKKPESKPPLSSTAPTITNVINTAVSNVGDYGQGSEQAGAQGRQPQPGNGNPDAMLQQRAAAWHNEHSQEDDPKWQFIANGDKQKTFVKYRYFNKSDGCLEIVRSENGKKSDKWVLNPLPAGQIHVDAKLDVPRFPMEGPVEAPDRQALQVPSRDFSRKLRELLPVETPVLAAVQYPTNEPGTATPVQVPSGPQFCLNPHPGQYTWSWGPVNGCQQAQFRTFQDGCSHYQMFNVCAGVWEPQVYWTYCRAH